MISKGEVNLLSTLPTISETDKLSNIMDYFTLSNKLAISLVKVSSEYSILSQEVMEHMEESTEVGNLVSKP